MKKNKIKEIKHVFAMLSIVFAMFFAVNSLIAQVSEPCLPDCVNDTWVPAYPNMASEYNIELCEINGQSYYAKVRYRIRSACNGMYQDLYIEEIGLGFCAACWIANPDVEAVLNDITLKLIVANPMGFDPDETGEPCKDNWRVMKGGCWHFDVIPSVDEEIPANPVSDDAFDWVLMPCEYQECCLEFFTVCLDAEGKRIITNTGYQPPDEPCIEEYCVPVCGSIYR